MSHDEKNNVWFMMEKVTKMTFTSMGFGDIHAEININLFKILHVDNLFKLLKCTNDFICSFPYQTILVH